MSKSISRSSRSASVSIHTGPFEKRPSKYGGLGGYYTEAEPLYQRSLVILEKALGSDHSDVGQSLNNLALLYQVQGHYTEAEPLYQRSLAISEKALGPEYPEVATSLENYAALLRDTGRGELATTVELRAKAIHAKHAEQNPVECHR